MRIYSSRYSSSFSRYVRDLMTYRPGNATAYGELKSLSSDTYSVTRLACARSSAYDRVRILANTFILDFHHTCLPCTSFAFTILLVYAYIITGNSFLEEKLGLETSNGNDTHSLALLTQYHCHRHVDQDMLQ